MPSIEFLLKKSEGAPVDLSLWRLIVWGLGLCLFGVVFGVPLRKQVIIREKLKFPSGTATALMISVLHGGADEKERDTVQTQGTEEREELLRASERDDQDDGSDTQTEERDTRADWKLQIKLLLEAFAGSGLYTLLQYFVPVLHRLPVFGLTFSEGMGMDSQPITGVCRPRHHHGTCNHFSHAPRSCCRMGCAFAYCKTPRVGALEKSMIGRHGSKGWIVWVSISYHACRPP